MTTKADFTDEEWATLVRAPFVAGMSISLADPGGPIEAAKETLATLKVATSAASSDQQLVRAVGEDIEASARAHHNPLSGFKPRSEQDLLDELRRINELVTAKASPGEAAAFRDWLKEAAKKAADAAKEGGFMGFHAVRVSEGEQRMLDELDSVLGG
jgi:hypothetical protein